MFKITDFISESGTLTRAGMGLIHHYYVSKNKNSELSPIYLLVSPSDFSVLKYIIPKKNHYGVITKHDNDLHKTPIIFRGNQVIVIDSVGEAYNQSQVIKAISLAMPKAEFTVTKQQRQSDSVSCGSEAFLAMKEALRLGDKIFEDYSTITSEHNHHGGESPEYYLPISIAKYTQSTLRLVNVFRKGGKPRLLDRFPSLAKQTMTVNKTGKEETLLDYLKRHNKNNCDSKTFAKYVRYQYGNFGSKGVRNTVAEDRREKHRKIVAHYLATKSEKFIKQKILEAYQVDVTKRSPEKLLPLFYSEKTSRDEFLTDLDIREKKSDQPFKCCIYRFACLSNSEYLTKKIKAIKEKYKKLEEDFLFGDEDVTLRTLAKHRCMVHYLKTSMDRLDENSIAKKIEVYRNRQPVSTKPLVTNKSIGVQPLGQSNGNTRLMR